MRRRVSETEVASMVKKMRQSFGMALFAAHDTVRHEFMPGQSVERVVRFVLERVESADTPKGGAK